MSDAILCDRIAADLNKQGLSAAGIHTGGGVYCVEVELANGGALLWGMADETWGASIQDTDRDYTGADVWSTVPSDSTDIDQIVKAIAELSRENGARVGDP